MFLTYLFVLLCAAPVGVSLRGEISIPIHDITSKAHCDPTPYLLPADHPLRPILDRIFSTPSVLRDDESLQQAGFTIIAAHKTSYVRVLTHPDMRKYIIKTYVSSEPKRRKGFTGLDWLVRRCLGAQTIRSCIQSKRMKYFTVPQKWLYQLPNQKKLYVLIAQKMNIYSKERSLIAWKEKVNARCLDEFFLLMKLGCASKHLSVNVPYTREGMFAFIDTEYPEHSPALAFITHFLSPAMQEYWRSIIKK